MDEDEAQAGDVECKGEKRKRNRGAARTARQIARWGIVRFAGRNASSAYS